MKRILVGSAMAILFSAGAWAAPFPTSPADCQAAKTLADLIADNAVGGCEHQDKVFSNFAWTSSLAAASVNVVHEFTASPGGNTDVHGWNFSTAGGFTTGFTLSYDVTVVTNCLTNVNCGPELGTDTTFQRLFASVDQEQSGFTPNGTKVVDTQTFGTLTVTGTSPATETAQITYVPALALHTSSVFTTSSTGMQTFEQDFFETNVAIPEPATLAVCGGALVLLGFLKKRRA
jgi:hypothetical protein